MIRLAIMCAFTGLAAVADVRAVGAEPEPKLVWSDEFDGDSIDYSKWGVEVNAFGGGNRELQIYTDRKENVRVEDGHLVIEARNDNFSHLGTTRRYSSGRIRTKHRGDWKFGRVEVRAKLPSGRGIWSAIWMLPTEEMYGGWAASGEIDIVEMKGQQPGRVYGTLHHGGEWPKNKHTGEHFDLPDGSFADDFHVFAIAWDANAVRWFIDSELYQTQSEWNTEGGEFPAPFDQRFHLIMNVAVGGDFVGSPDDSTRFPQRLLVDYVRIYQQHSQP